EEIVDARVLLGTAVDPEGGGGAAQERRLEGGIARGARLLDEALGDLPPARGGVLELLEGLLRLVVLGVELEGRLVGHDGAALVEQLFAAETPELAVERRLEAR